MAENLTIDINSLKEKGFITTVVDPNKLTKDNLSTYVTQVGVASKLLEMLSKDEDIPVVDDNDPGTEYRIELEDKMKKYQYRFSRFSELVASDLHHSFGQQKQSLIA